MKGTLCILGNDAPSHLIQVLARAGYAFIYLDEEQEVSEEHFRNIFLLLVPESAGSLEDRLNTLPIPDHVPRLIIGVPPASANRLDSFSSTKFIDYLDPQASPETLLHRVSFLKKVSQVANERSSYLNQYHSFLDWFSNRDGLTGLYNRHHFNQQLEKQFKEIREQGGELSLLLLDIDNFAAINKGFGQSFGDFVINELAARITSSIGTAGSCFRLSGGEFAVILPDTALAPARSIGNGLLVRCEEKVFARNTHERRVTLSIGLASLTFNTPSSYDELVNMAQAALFKAKAEGRNRLYIFAPNEASEFSSASCNFDTVKLTISRLLEKTRHSTISSLQLLARDIAGAGHHEHLERVTKYLELLGKRLGLSDPIIRTLQNAAILHNSIRQLMHNDLLSKKDRFSQQDQTIMRDFPYKLSEIVDIFDYFSQERLVLLTQTERFDGNGYPEGLKGDEIPLGARLIGIVDAFAAMSADRPYRSSFTPEMVLEELKNEAGKQFDPFLVTSLLDIITEHQLLEVQADKVAQIRAELAAKLSDRTS